MTSSIESKMRFANRVLLKYLERPSYFVNCDNSSFVFNSLLFLVFFDKEIVFLSLLFLDFP